MSFLKFEPTEENRQKLQKALHPDKLVYPVVLDGLLAHPLARIGFYWSKVMYRSGLSPFAYAGITGQSPRKVMKQLEKEGTFTHISLCSVVQLPVCSLTYGIQYDRWPTNFTILINTYDNDVLGKEEEEEEEGIWRTHTSSARAPYSPRWKNRTLEQMLKRYGGPSWRRHCTRVFDPFRANECEQLEGISPEQWRDMQKVYLLGEKPYAPTKSA
jgi:hypothetical protein